MRVAAAALAVACGILRARASINCAAYSGDCSECTIQATCGYCASTQACTAGNVEGPLIGTCEVVAWAYYEDTCGCWTEASSCGECVDNENCMWCLQQSTEDEQYACKSIRDNCPSTTASRDASCPGGSLSPLTIAFGIVLPIVFFFGCCAACFYAARGRRTRYPPRASYITVQQNTTVAAPINPAYQAYSAPSHHAAAQQAPPGTATLHGAPYAPQYGHGPAYGAGYGSAAPQPQAYPQAGGASHYYSAAPGGSAQRPSAPMAEAVPPPSYGGM